MAISIKGVNTGVIRQKNEFVALALKIKEPRNKESLFFLSPLGLRDLLIALESRLSTKHQLSEDKRVQYEKECEKASKKMHENIPLIQEDELKNADINRRIDSLTLVDDKGENLAFSLTLHDGKKDELLVNELQIQVLAHAIIHAINNAGMRDLALELHRCWISCRCTMWIASKTTIWNTTLIHNPNGNITCLIIIWRLFTAIRMIKEKPISVVR